MTTSILLLVASLALLILEVFVVSFGALAVVAAACGVGSILTAFAESPLFGWTVVGLLVAGGPLAVWTAFRLLPKIPFARGFYLRKPQLTQGDRAAAAPAREDLLGAVGVATTQLRPAGTAEFNGEPQQVVTTGSLIAKGERVRVVSVTGNRIAVEADS